MLKELHDNQATRHEGFLKTYYNAKQSFFWKFMNVDIQKHVAECDNYQINKNENILVPDYSH